MSPLPLENIEFVWPYLLYDDLMVIIYTRIISAQNIYGLYRLKHHIVGRTTTNKQTNNEDRAAQPMEAGG